MKKTILYFIVLMLSMVITTGLFAQNAPIDFEAGGYGADWTWTVFENEANPPVVIMANPDASGVNTSTTVAQFTALQAGAPWAGTESQHGTDIGTYNIDASNSTIKIMVWKTVISDVGIKLVKNDGWSMGEIKVANTITNAWEELTFNFTAHMESGYDQIVIFPDFDLAGRTQDNICYFDNVTFSEGSAAPDGPEVSAPAPTQNEVDVISIFSDSYSDLAGTDFNPGWGQSTVVSTVDIEGNSTLKYANFNYQGTQFDGSHDLSAMEYMHIDMWTPDATVVQVTPISEGTGEILLSLTPITMGSWNSYDILLTDFTGLSMSDIHQLKFDGQGGVNPSNIYLDNIYFWKTSNEAPDLFTTASVLGSNYPNPFNPVTTISFSLAEPGNVALQIFNIKGQLVETLIDGYRTANTYKHTWNAPETASGIYFYRLSVNNKTIDTKRMILLK